MRKFGALLAILMLSSAALAGPIPANVGFSFTIVDNVLPAGCTWTWILPNNAPPDFFYPFGVPSGDPGYSNVSVANSCSPGSGYVSDIIFFSQGGIAFNGYWLGPTLYDQTASDISFRIGTFALRDEFDYQHVIIDIHAAPEPAALLLVMGGFAAILWSRTRKAKKKAH